MTAVARFRLACTAALLCAACPAAAQLLEVELQRCAALADAGLRLACFDRIVAGARARTELGSGGGASTPQAADASRVPTVTTASPATLPSTAPHTSGRTASADAGFGLPERRVGAPLDRIESRVVGAFEGWTADGRLVLENGQVWQIADGSSASYRLRDPRIRITRGLLGSFFAEIEGVLQTPRVRRVR